MLRKKTRRSENGAIAAVLMVILVLVVIVGAAFSFDYANGLVVKEQLQNATDAGALAGAIELAGDNIKQQDETNAENYARAVAGENKADNQSVSPSSPGVVLNVSMNSKTIPRTVTVTTTKTTGNLFARMIGWNTMPISATSTASVSKGLKQIKPNQLYPIAVSLDFKPSKGPQKGKALQDIAGPNQPFTMVLNPQNSKNTSWLKNWTGKSNPLTEIGQDQLLLNGVKANLVKGLSPGDVIAVPIIKGGPPFNKSRTIVGVMGFEITKIKFPLHIIGKIKDPIILKGTPGQPLAQGISQKGANFLDKYAPWSLSLTN